MKWTPAPGTKVVIKDSGEEKNVLYYVPEGKEAAAYVVTTDNSWHYISDIRLAPPKHVSAFLRARRALIRRRHKSLLNKERKKCQTK